MRILVVLAHPDKNSFNHAIAGKVLDTLAKAGHKAIFHDLYAEGFNPILPAAEIPAEGQVDGEILTHCEQVASAEGIVIIHPNWWGQPPAILKGWVDRVIRPGVAYRFLEGDIGEGVPVGLLQAKTALVFNTSNTSADREERVFGDPLEAIWKDCIFGLCGVQDVHRVMYRIMVDSTPKERQQWLADVARIVGEVYDAQQI